MKKNSNFNKDEVILKNCPFCGGRAYITETLQKMHIECEHTSDCVASPGTWLRSSLPLEEQIRGWNTRRENVE